MLNSSDEFMYFSFALISSVVCANMFMRQGAFCIEIDRLITGSCFATQTMIFGILTFGVVEGIAATLLLIGAASAFLVTMNKKKRHYQ